MSQKEKLISRLFERPKDFTYQELQKLMSILGYEEKTKGKTAGSRRIFYNPKTKRTFFMHKPHPEDILKSYVIKQLIDFLEEDGGLFNE